MEDSDTTTVAPPTTPQDAPAPEASGTGDYEFFDYWGVDENYRVDLPGPGGQWVECRVLTEGDRRAHQNKMNKGVQIDRKSDTATMPLAPGDERLNLLKMSIVGWKLLRRDVRTGNVTEVPYRDTTRDQWLAQAPPSVIDLIDKEIRKHNSWLLGEMTLEDIDREIEHLTEMREVRARDLEGKDS